MKKIAVLLGSLSEKSINKALAKSIERLAEGRLQFDYVDIASLPFYNNDIEANPPGSVTRLKAQVEAADAVLIVMPEFNRSFPAVIKNALDWASRPYGHNSWQSKPLALAGASPGGTGTAVGQNHLRTILPLLGFIVMGQPEIYFQFTPGVFDDHFDVTNDQARTLLAGFVDKYVDWIDHHGTPAIRAAAE